MCEKCHQLLAVGRWFPPGTPVSSTRKLTSSSSFHLLEMTLAVAEAINPNQPNQTLNELGSVHAYVGYMRLLDDTCGEEVQTHGPVG